MKKSILIVFGLFFAHFSFSQAMEDFKWLEGKWERQNVRPGTTAFEVWERTSDGYSGLGISMRGADTTFVESLALVEKDETIYYVANVSSNAEPTYFKVTEISKTGFESENPQHDFPKKIQYFLEGEKLTAVISAGEKTMGFIFKKMN